MTSKISSVSISVTPNAKTGAQAQEIQLRPLDSKFRFFAKTEATFNRAQHKVVSYGGKYYAVDRAHIQNFAGKNDEEKRNNLQTTLKNAEKAGKTMTNSSGKITYADGTKYEGSIRNGLPHGNGVMTKIEGTVDKVGYTFKQTTATYKDGKPTGTAQITKYNIIEESQRLSSNPMPLKTYEYEKYAEKWENGTLNDTIPVSHKFVQYHPQLAQYYEYKTDYEKKGHERITEVIYNQTTFNQQRILFFNSF